jgi:hypothetical protein
MGYYSQGKNEYYLWAERLFTEIITLENQKQMNIHLKKSFFVKVQHEKLFRIIINTVKNVF